MTDERSDRSPGRRQASRVVLAGAEPARQAGLVQGLRRRGVELHLASTAREGIGCALSIGPDVLVLCAAADAGGIALLRALRREEALEAVPVILLSPPSNAAARVLALRAGASDVMAASSDAGELIERIQAQLRLGQARRAATERARSEERRRLAREVHDRLGQLLTAANIDLRLLERRTQESAGVPPRDELLRELGSARSSVEQAIASVQDIAQLLRAPELEAGGLAAALRGEAEHFQRRFGLGCSVRHAGAACVEPPPAVAGELLCICREALTNVLRHADATLVQIQLAVRGRDLLLRVCDDGVGIPRGAAHAPAAIGIAGMAERACSIGACLHIRGRPGCGTILSVRWRLLPS